MQEADRLVAAEKVEQGAYCLATLAGEIGVVLDQVGTGAAHDVAIALQRLLERGRSVGLDPVDDARQVGVDWRFTTADARIVLRRLYPASRLR